MSVSKPARKMQWLRATGTGSVLGPIAILVLVAGLGACTGRGTAPTTTLSHESAADQRPRSTQVVTAAHGVVVAGHPEAAQIGVDILATGGNAMDAAVAVSFALAVAEPYGSGLGGKLMMLYYDASADQVTAIDAMDQAGSAFDSAAFATLDPEERVAGWASVAVPGLVSGIFEGHSRWGRLPWRDTVAPAADLARRGTEVLPGTVKLVARRIDRIRTDPAAEALYLPGGELPRVGSRWVNADLGQTLDTIAEQGDTGFYEGWVAAAISAASQAAGGSISLDDLRAYSPRVIEPLRLNFGDFVVVGAPPPASGSATVLAALARLQGLSWPGAAALDARHLDRVGRTLRELYPGIQAQIADVPGARSGYEALIASGPSETVGEDSGVGHEAGTASRIPDGSTTHFVVIDQDGNMASVTQSLSHHFGAGVVAPGTGVLFNNSLKNFSFHDTDSPNLAAPGKRPRSTIAPTMVFKHGRPWLALGLPGGQRIPTATLQVLLDVLVFGADVADAVSAPRVHFVRPPNPAEAHVFELEKADAEMEKALRDAGWTVRVNDDSEAFGGFCVAEIRPDGTRVGIADFRRTNAARGQAAPATDGSATPKLLLTEAMNPTHRLGARRPVGNAASQIGQQQIVWLPSVGLRTALILGTRTGEPARPR